MTTLSDRVLQRPVESALGSSVAVMDQSALAAHGATGQQCVLQRQQGQAVGVEGRRDGPSDDLAGAYVGDEGDVAESGEDPHVGHVSDPQAVRLLCSKAPLDQIREGIGHVSGVCGDRLPATPYPLKASSSHEPGDLVTAHVPASAPHRMVHLPHPVDAVVLGVDAPDLRQENLIPQSSGRGWACLGGPVAAGGDEPTFCRAEHAADGPGPELITVLVDEPDHLVVGRSISAAKKAEAALRISLARRASASSRRKRRFSSSSDSLLPADGSVGP